MDISQLYSFVLTLVLVGMILGVGVLVLDRFQASGMTTAAGTALNDSRDAIGDIASDWMGIIALVGAIAVIIFLVIRGFMGSSRRK